MGHGNSLYGNRHSVSDDSAVTRVFKPLTIQNLICDVPLFLAPMAGITHSAFRRLVASFGGYGALFTEMIPVHPLLAYNLHHSPLTKRRDEEGVVICQMVITSPDSIGAAVKRLQTLAPAMVDINLGCPAPMITRKGGGRALHDDLERLKTVLDTVRSSWHGPLSVKCRLGHETPDWQEQFLRRLALYREAGIDALTVHPRFFHEKLKRYARWQYFPWIREHWKGPLVGNGDMVDAKALALLDNGSCDGLMIGRAAVQKPWIFRQLSGEAVDIDYCDVWERLYRFTAEDFEPHRILPRMKEFTSYFAKNFFFGHELFRLGQGAASCEELHPRVTGFLRAGPRLSR